MKTQKPFLGLRPLCATFFLGICLFLLPASWLDAQPPGSLNLSNFRVKLTQQHQTIAGTNRVFVNIFIDQMGDQVKNVLEMHFDFAFSPSFPGTLLNVDQSNSWMNQDGKANFDLKVLTNGHLSLDITRSEAVSGQGLVASFSFEPAPPTVTPCLIPTPGGWVVVDNINLKKGLPGPKKLAEILQCEIYNLQGQLIRICKHPEGDYLIGLEPGVYLMRSVSVSGEVISKKFML